MKEQGGMAELSPDMLARLRDEASASTVEGVLQTMEALDATLLTADGVRQFNQLYLTVTRENYRNPSGWADPERLNRLDVLFARLYFEVLADWHTEPTTVPRAWTALFASCYRQDVERVQFALAGMKAHINHDLPIALAPTCAAFGMEPERESYQYRDFKAVNDILGAVEPQALEHLATGLLGMVVQNLGRLRHVLSMWSVTTARDTAWTKPSWAGTFATGPSRDRTSFSCSTA